MSSFSSNILLDTVYRFIILIKILVKSIRRSDAVRKSQLTVGACSRNEVTIMRKSFFKSLAIYLVFAVFLMTLPAQGWAMFIPSGQPDAVRQADLNSIQKTLETAMIKQRLADFGLSSEEAMSRINSLSDAQIHQFAENLDSLQAGADGVDTLIFLLLVAVIVVLVLELTGHHVIVR